MKRWAVLTVILFFVALLVLSLPGLMVAFQQPPSASDLAEVYGNWAVWIWAGVMVLGQALLLLVPIGLAERRPKPRRKLMVPVLTTTFFITLLILCAGGCVLLAIWGDGPGPPGSASGPPISPPFNTPKQFWITTAITTLLLWGFWGAVFYYFRRSTNPDTLTNRLMRWLLGGSILELLVAVPSHIIVRQRGDCCAPVGTFLGMATGIAVMLMSFGPGVFFLFAKRMDLLRGYGKNRCWKCGYDLRATPDRCPECGTVVEKRDPAEEGAS